MRFQISMSCNGTSIIFNEFLSAEFPFVYLSEGNVEYLVDGTEYLAGPLATSRTLINFEAIGSLEDYRTVMAIFKKWDDARTKVSPESVGIVTDIRLGQDEDFWCAFTGAPTATRLGQVITTVSAFLFARLVHVEHHPIRLYSFRVADDLRVIETKCNISGGLIEYSISQSGSIDGFFADHCNCFV